MATTTLVVLVALVLSEGVFVTGGGAGGKVALVAPPGA
jgi:hypothetical protein